MWPEIRAKKCRELQRTAVLVGCHHARNDWDKSRHAYSTVTWRARCSHVVLWCPQNTRWVTTCPVTRLPHIVRIVHRLLWLWPHTGATTFLKSLSWPYLLCSSFWNGLDYFWTCGRLQYNTVYAMFDRRYLPPGTLLSEGGEDEVHFSPKSYVWKLQNKFYGCHNVIFVLFWWFSSCQYD